MDHPLCPFCHQETIGRAKSASGDVWVCEPCHVTIIKTIPVKFPFPTEPGPVHVSKIDGPRLKPSDKP